MPTFLEPDPERAAYGADLALPLALDPNDDLAEISGLPNLLSALPVRAITRRGEVPHRQADGLDVEDFQNAPNAPEQSAVMQARMLEQYGAREDRLQSVRVDITQINDDGDVRALITGTAIDGSAVVAEAVV